MICRRQCGRCVQEVFTDDGKAVFALNQRGSATHVGIDYVEEARLSDEQAIRAMHICPTGAITPASASPTCRSPQTA